MGVVVGGPFEYAVIGVDGTVDDTDTDANTWVLLSDTGANTGVLSSIWLAGATP